VIKNQEHKYSLRYQTTQHRQRSTVMHKRHSHSRRSFKSQARLLSLVPKKAPWRSAIQCSNKLGCALCRGANPRQLEGQSGSGWHRTTGHCKGSSSWVRRQSSENTRTLCPWTLTFWTQNQCASTDYRELTTVPSLKSFRSGVFVLSC